jgi:RNA polymerase sigma factor (sigma-70 family)
MMPMDQESSPHPGAEDGVLLFPAASPTAADRGLAELEVVYAFIYARVGNRHDAEDLTQQVAMKAIPRLNEAASVPSIRAYLFATARSVLATFWSAKFGLPVEELREELVAGLQAIDAPPSNSGARDRVELILALLPDNYRKLLELRFLRGYSLKEVASEMGSTVGAVKVMQLRALRSAARAGQDA